MRERLFHALIRSKNQAADDVLLEALRVGDSPEQRAALDALLQRHTTRGLGGIIGLYDRLPEAIQLQILNQIKLFHHALRECGRSDDTPRRLAALKLIALGRQGKLAYVLSENLHDADEALSKAATEAMVALARWVATETRAIQRGAAGGEDGKSKIEDGRALHAPSSNLHGPSSRSNTSSSDYAQLLEQRPEIEAAIARAMDVHRGRHGQDLLRAALLLCDWPGSKTLAILHTAKHGGQSPMIRRLQQPPASEGVPAFLLGGSHGHLRSHFGTAFGHIDQSPVLDALLRQTHWLKDNNLQLCMRQASRGPWFGEAELKRDVERRSPEEAARIAEWIVGSGTADALQDQRLETLRLHAADSFPARLRILRAASRRPRGTSVALLRSFLTDPDERLVRMAAREIVRRRPADFENMLLQLMTGAPESVRRVISRSIGRAGFEHFWQKFDLLAKPVRRNAGRAMLKILPDAVQRLRKRLAAGSVDQRLKAMQIAHELELGESFRTEILSLASDPNPRLRSKAVAVAGDMKSIGPEMLVDRMLNDPDARVRANTIEVLESREDGRLVPALAARAHAPAAHNRERANAIKALHRMRLGTVSDQLQVMLRDGRADHRISGLWALKQIGWWQLLGEVGRLARSDDDMRVRRYALGVLRGVADLANERRAALAKAG